jgi:MFS family permease
VPRLMDRVGPARMMVTGSVLIVAGMLWLTRLTETSGYLGSVVGPMMLFGFGAGLVFIPLVSRAVSGVRPEDAGAASGLVNVVQQVGGALGLAVLATLASEHTASLRDAGESTASALNSGYHLGYLVAAGLTFVALVIAGTVLRERGMAAAPAHAQQGEPDTACAEAA